MTAFMRQYVAERLPLGVFVPVTVGLALVAAWVGAALARGGVTSALVLVSLLVWQFRLWDDAEDRVHDALSHPDRVVVRSGAGVVWGWVVVLATVALVVAGMIGGRASLAAVVTLDLLFVTFYRLFRAKVADAVWRFVLLPAKYPAFVAVVAVAIGTADRSRLAIAMVVTHLVACGHEFWHTRPTHALGDLP